MDAYALVELNPDGGIKRIVRTYCTQKRANQDAELLTEAFGHMTKFEVQCIEHIDD